MHSQQDGDGGYLTRTTSTPTSTLTRDSNVTDISQSEILHHGEIQIAGSVFRKKSQYFVLTSTHLVRFKSRSRASEVFPSIPLSLGRTSGMRHSRMSSSGSLHDLQSSSSTESQNAMSLNEIVAVYKLDDGRPYFSIEVSHLDDETYNASVLTFQFTDPKDSELWLSSIKGAVSQALLKNNALPFSKYLIDYTVRALEQEHDYNPNQFHVFRVVQRATKSGSRSSSDDLSKLTSSICILAIGVNKIHLVPLPKSSRTASSTSLSEMNCACHGVAALTAIYVHDYDDAFTLVFRLPLRQQSTLCLASSCVTDIAIWTRQSADYLRPLWLQYPFTWNVTQAVEEELVTVPSSEDGYHCYDRTLCAYCEAYSVDTSKIRYTVNYRCEDSPEFQLLPPADHTRTEYSILELLAIMRALRFNETFSSISFRNISLDSLHGLRDPYGSDHVPWETRGGELVNQLDQENFTLLVQEIQGLALKSKQLRRLDFSYSLKRKPQADNDDISDPGSGFCEALFPLCSKQWTNVDWIILNGVTLTETDIDYLFAAVIDRSCHFRAIDVANCGLEHRRMRTVLQGIFYQGGTMESIDLSGNPARLDPKHLQDQVSEFEFMRKVNLSNISRTSGPDALISADIMLSWKLEELRLSSTPLNANDVDSLAVYLRSPQSNLLHSLYLDRCKLTGADAQTILDAMNRGPWETRNIWLELSGNPLEEQHDVMVKAISHSCAPSKITMQMLEYKDEKNFSKLLEAFAVNCSTRYLDISKVSLPSDASEETVGALRRLFAENAVLEELDISGERTHLEAANLGSGLNPALTGLESNAAMIVLRLEHQQLGLHGASILASIFKGGNKTLREVHCEDNEISLQALTILVNSLELNTTVLQLGPMDADRAFAQKRVDQEVEKARDTSNSAIAADTKAKVKRTLGKTLTGQKLSGQTSIAFRGLDKPSPSRAPSELEIRAAMATLSQNWDQTVARLDGYLERNRRIAHGLPLKGPGFLDVTRPGTSGSLAAAIEDISLEKTPTMEAHRELGAYVDDGADDRTPKMEMNRELGAGVDVDEDDELLMKSTVRNPKDWG